MNNIRQAILLAADHIERNPGEFKFIAINIPDGPGCGTPGCALGWIGVYAGMSAHPCGYSHVSTKFLELPAEPQKSYQNEESATEFTFYNRMNEVSGDCHWQFSAAKCAAALRLYADKYHPAAPIRYPDWNAMAAKRTVAEDA